MGLCVYVGYGIGQVFVGHHGENGAEDLLAHDGIGACDVVHHGGRDAKSIVLPLSAYYDLFVVDERAHPVVVLWRNYFAVSRIFKGIFAELFCNFSPDCRYELFLYGRVNEDVVGRDAGLPAV